MATIHTKFNPSDSVWIIHENKARRVTVHSIVIVIKDMDIDTRYYFREIDHDPRECGFCEERIFGTREELTEYIFRDVTNVELNT